MRTGRETKGLIGCWVKRLGIRISVMVCTYDGARYDLFTECVESVLAQTYAPIELVIVVDDASAIAALIREYFADTEEVVGHDNDENRGSS